MAFPSPTLHSRLIDEGRLFEYRMVIRSRDRTGAQALSQHLRGLPGDRVPHLADGGLTQCKLTTARWTDGSHTDP